MFERLQKWMQDSRDAIARGIGAGSVPVKPTRAEVLQAVAGCFDEARSKLGESFFTRRLSPGTRRRKLRSLTKFERAAARSAGWIR